MEHNKTCEFCGKSFLSSRSDARFCSAVCRTSANKKLKRGERSDVATVGRVQAVRSSPSTPNILQEVLRVLHLVEDRMSVTQEETYLTPGQVCEMLSISKTTFDRYVRDGLLKTFYLRGRESKTKKKIYVRKSDVVSLFQENK